MPERLGTAWSAGLAVSAKAAPAMTAMATMMPMTMPAILPLDIGFFSGTWKPPCCGPDELVGMRPVTGAVPTARGMDCVRLLRSSGAVGAALMSDVASPRFTMRPAR